MKTILITGGAGFIGGHFVEYVKNNTNLRIVVVDCLNYASSKDRIRSLVDNDRIFFEKSDINNQEIIEGILRKYQPSYIVNFAAHTHVDNSISNPKPFISSNINGTCSLIESLRHHKNEFRFVQISTDEVYGSSLKPCDERARLNPSSPYSASKASSDLLCLSYFKTWGFPVIITRSANNYGPWQYPEKLIPYMLKCHMNGKPMPVYGEGKNTRNWLHVEDNCEAILKVLTNGRIGEVYNISSDVNIKNIDVVLMIKEEAWDITGMEPRIEFVKDRLGHDFKYSISSSKIRKELNWEPKHDFEIGLRETVMWYLEDKKRLV